MTAGQRKVRIEMQGYRPYETEFELTAGQAAEVRAVLAKGGAGTRRRAAHHPRTYQRRCHQAPASPRTPLSLRHGCRRPGPLRALQPRPVRVACSTCGRSLAAAVAYGNERHQHLHHPDRPAHPRRRIHRRLLAKYASLLRIQCRRRRLRRQCHLHRRAEFLRRRPCSGLRAAADCSRRPARTGGGLIPRRPQRGRVHGHRSRRIAAR